MSIRLEPKHRKLLALTALLILVVSTVSASELQNIERITPFSSQNINVTGTIDMSGNPIIGISNLGGSNIVNSGNINSGAVSVNELDTGSVDDRYVNRGGDVMSGDLDFQSNGGVNSANFLNVGSITSNNGDSDILFHQGFTVDGDSGGDGSVTLETGNLNMNNNDVADFNQLVTGRGGRVMTFNNPNGGNSEIRFRSGENSGSDYGYINAIDDVDGSGENFGLELGTMNDGADASNDHIRLIPAGDLYLNPGGNDDSNVGETIHNGTLNMDGNPITNADWSDAGDLDASGSINDFSAANDLDSSGSLTSGSVSDNEIADNTVDNSEIQNGGSFTFNGVTLNAPLDTNGNHLNLDDGDQYITIHDGSGNFNIKSGIDPNNNIVAGTGGTHVRLDESGGFDVSVDESTGTGNAKSEGVGFAVNGGQVEIRDGSLELNNNNINGIGGLQNCGANEFVNGNGNCEVDTDTDTTVADDQDLSVGADPAGGGETTIDIDNGNSATFTDDNTQLDDVAATGNVDAGGNRVENVADPNSDDDAVPRGYADSRYAASSDYFWTSISLETGDYRMSNGSSGSMTVPGSGTTNCDGGACIRNFGSGMWGIEMSPPSIAFDEADMPGRVCWGYSGGDNEQDNQGWGAGIRSTITDDNGHCMQGSSIGGSCAASYLYDDSTTSHDTYGVVCKTLD
ncbi:hypothetical protein [Candidatus Nanohalococcus occultus]|uniref:Uncharacterized protein n=1 Tax=Candidatus Nanohalococcus occultus TaxID=2978047 RepID=A0ABY8CJE4_9ARCH|nr:hypothetical protein SVXNc_0799 [Candidatus Nanohaloarchaeota archaeon SVXNc]